MLQEDKELLLKDLSARLLYGVYVQTKASDEITTEGILWDVGYDETESFIFCKGSSLGYSIDDDIIKPYLRPMSSMTEEEKLMYEGLMIGTADNISYMLDVVDWLNKKMFDYRGLIPKGLAIEVTEKNNPYKE